VLKRRRAPRPAATSAKARAPSQLMAVFRTLGLDGMFGEPDLRIVHQHSGKAFGPACTLIDLTDETCRWPVGEPGEADFAYCGAAPSSAIPIASPIA
jgi:GcrA cell cycle regulator